MRRNSAAFAILVGGLIAGTLDLTYAVVFSAFRGVAPLRILQSVASGLLGSAAFDGGAATAVLGVFLHYFIMFSAAAVFYLASRRLDFLARRPVIAGVIFGLCMYAVMTFVVLPLSAFPYKQNFTLVLVSANLFVHMFFVGVPISLACRNAKG